MTHRARAVTAFEQEKREPVVRADLVRGDLDRALVRSDGVFQPARSRVGNRNVLQILGILGVIAQRETIRRQRRVEIALPLQRDGFAQIIDTARAALIVGRSAQQAAPPGHSAKMKGCGRWSRRRVALRSQSYDPKLEATSRISLWA